MLVLDTDVLTILQRGTGVDFARLSTRLSTEAAQSVFTTIITFEEQARGWLALLASARTPAKQRDAYGKLHSFLRDFSRRQILDFDETPVVRFEELQKAKVRIGVKDLRIAAIALAHDATLLSRNLKDFRKVPGLRVEDWTV